MMKRIKPQHLAKQVEGFCWTEYRICLPESVALVDLNEDVELFAGLGLREDDALRVVAHDRSWACQCFVVEASPTRVTLSKPAMLWSNKTGRVGVEHEDVLYEIKWGGSNYELWRKGEGNRQPMMLRAGFTSISAAKIELSRQYPKVA